MRRFGWVIALVVMIVLAARLNRGHEKKATQADDLEPETAGLRVLAGSELKDLAFLKTRLEKAVGQPVKFEYVGTLDMVDRLAVPDAPDANSWDLAWAASNKYLGLVAPGRVKASEKTMLSPVVLGLKADKLKSLGWDKTAPTWAQIAAAVKANKLAFAMTNPAASNSGFSAVVGVAAALAGKGDSLEAGDVDPVRLREFFAGVKLTAGSSGWLADAYVDSQARLDGLINYESVILSLNEGDKLQQKLVPVYPQEGIITADYPLMLLNEANKPAYEKFVAFVKSPEVQQEIMEHTFRRPVVAGVTPLPVFGKALLVELPFPGRRETVDAILTSYLDEVRTPAHSYFVLDVSGSMGDEGRMENLKAALRVLGGGDTATLGGRFARFQLRERADVLTFDNRIESEDAVSFADRARYPAAIGQFGQLVEDLQPKGGTAIYTALKTAYEKALADRKREPGYYYTVVLMTDGENNAGLTYDEFRGWYESLPETDRDIRVFTILFGEGNAEELKALAEFTGGRVFDAKKASLTTVFKDIRGYQ